MSTNVVWYVNFSLKMFFCSLYHYRPTPVPGTHHVSPSSVFVAIVAKQALKEPFTSEKLLLAEYHLWCQKWASVEKKPHDILEILDACDPAFFPSIAYLLQTLATLPVSTATVEKTFSSMKRVKTYLRNKMGDQRLSDLALLTIHWHLTPNVDSVLDVMSTKPRRILLL